MILQMSQESLNYLGTRYANVTLTLLLNKSFAYSYLYRKHKK